MTAPSSNDGEIGPSLAEGAVIRDGKARRAYAYAVLADGSVQVNDVFAGFRGSLAREAVVDILAAAYAERSAPAWPVSSSAATGTGV